MPSKNKFGFEPLETKSVSPRERSVGPMGAAVREAAESLTEATEAKVEQRRQNAADAREYRAAVEDGLILRRVKLERVHTDELPRDRIDLDAVAEADEMEELKSSIRTRGQKEPVELYRGADGRLQLKKGWRRLTALTQLLSETGDEESFGEVIARVDEGEEEHLARYLDMVEENVVREDLTFAEMAQVAITAALDDRVEQRDADDLVLRLYGNLHKQKRSNIRAFVTLLETFEDALSWPKEISRNLGVAAARATRQAPELVTPARRRLERAASFEEQNEILDEVARAGQGGATPSTTRKRPAPTARQKFEFHVGKTKITARVGECRIVSKLDYASLPKKQLERAIHAFEQVLKEEEDGPRVYEL